MATPFRAIVSIVAAGSLLVGLVGCVPGASTAHTDLPAVLAKHGIATVPFDGGAPEQPVVGDTVLVLTDWQMVAIEASLPDSSAASAKTSTSRSGDISAQALDKSLASLPVDPSIPSQLTPSFVVQAWWALADSDRAKLARATLPAPKSGSAATLPLYVLVLFTADAMADFGRTSATIPAASGSSAYSALGADGAAGGADPCGAISGAIDDVNSFLDSAGIVGSVIRGAISAAIGGIDALTGGMLKLIKSIIAVVNIIMNVSSVLKSWYIDISAAPRDGYSVGVAPAPGDSGTVHIKIVGDGEPAPKAVSSCLALFALSDPTSQKGAKLTWDEWDGFQPGVAPSLIVPKPLPKEFDENNAASFGFTTGEQTVDTSQATEHYDLFPSFTAYAQRADVDKLTSWIRSLDSPAVHAILGDTIDGIAGGIEYAANPASRTVNIPVRYWVPNDKPKSDPNSGGDGSSGSSIPPIGSCLPPAVVEQVTKAKVVEHRTAPPAGLQVTGSPLASKPMCVYTLSTGASIIIVGWYAYDPTNSTDFAFRNLLGAGGCNQASGYIIDQPPLRGFYIWSGSELGAVFMYNGGSGDNPDWPRLTAQRAGMC